MSAKEKDVEIEDDLARGTLSLLSMVTIGADRLYSPESIARIEGQDLNPIEAQFRTREGCAISRYPDSAADPQPSED